MTLQHLRSSTANKRPDPTAMADGQIALNTAAASPGLFYKDSAGNLVKAGPVHVGSTAPNVSPASGGTAGNSTGESWLDTSGSNPLLKIWSGAAWQTVQPVASGTVVSTADTGSVTSTMIADGTIVNSDVNASAAIAGTKISPDFGSQNVTTTGTVTGASLNPTSSTVPTNGVYLPAANSVAISTGGSGRLFVDSSGRIGIGAASPSYFLHLSGSSNVESRAVTSGASSTAQWGAQNTTGATVVMGAGGSSYSPYGAIGVSNAYVYTGSDLAIATDGANVIKFATGAGVPERMRLDSSGRLGIGSSVPTELLTVGSDATGNNYIRINSANNTEAGVKFYGDLSTTKGYAIGYEGDGNLFFVRSDSAGTVTDRLVINDSGNVGIGTTSASERFHVVGGNSRFDGNYVSFNNNGYIRTDATNELRLQMGSSGTVFSNSGNTEIARFDTSGRLLVGTSTARNVAGTNGTLLVEGNQIGVVRNANDTNPASFALGKSRSGAAGGVTIVQNGDQLGALIFAGADGTSLDSRAASISAFVDGTPGANDMPGRLVFSTTADGASSPTERMRILNNGTTDLRATTDVFNVLSNAAAGTTNLLIRGGNSATSFTAYNIPFGVYTNGNVVNTNGSYTALSDAKLKENIIDASSQWADLKAIRIRNWNFKPETGNETHRQIGPIAQELEEVCPGLVFETPDRDADGNATGEVTKGVNQSVLYMKAVKALQEAMERIEQLEAKVAALESA